LKNRKLRLLFDSLKQEKNLRFEQGTKTFHLIFAKELEERVYLFQFAKQKNTTIHELDNKRDSINEIKVNDHPFVYVIFDVARQSVLIQKKSNVFQEIETASQFLENILTNKILALSAHLRIIPVTKPYAFWENINKLDSICSLKISMNSPNLFLGNKLAEEALKEYHDTSNNDSIELSLTSSDGNLVVSRDSRSKTNIDNYIDYTNHGGGYWEIRGIADGEAKRIKSNSFIQSVSMSEEDLLSGNDIVRQIDEVFSVEKNDDK
jgi:hypothetical protein